MAAFGDVCVFACHSSRRKLTHVRRTCLSEARSKNLDRSHYHQPSQTKWESVSTVRYHPEHDSDDAQVVWSSLGGNQLGKAERLRKLGWEPVVSRKLSLFESLPKELDIAFQATHASETSSGETKAQGEEVLSSILEGKLRRYVESEADLAYLTLCPALIARMPMISVTRRIEFACTTYLHHRLVEWM